MVPVHTGESPPNTRTAACLTVQTLTACVFRGGWGAFIKQQSDWVAPILEVFLEEAL